MPLKEILILGVGETGLDTLRITKRVRVHQAELIHLKKKVNWTEEKRSNIYTCEEKSSHSVQTCVNF